MEELKYVIENINGMTFESEDIPTFAVKEKVKSACRLTDANIAAMPCEDIDTLRCRLAELFYEKFGESYAKVERQCDIRPDTFSRYLKYKKGNLISYDKLAKFCVGAELTVEETKELFNLRGFPLNPSKKADYILLCEIANHGDVSDYIDDMKKYCNTDIASNPNGKQTQKSKKIESELDSVNWNK